MREQTARCGSEQDDHVVCGLLPPHDQEVGSEAMVDGCSQEKWRLGYRQALDGLRGLAVILVVVAHASEPLTDRLQGLGVAGVTIFFVLSGFLITSLLLEELHERGSINLKAFYQRRAARLLPALMVMLLIGTAMGMFSLPAVAATLLYVANWYQALTGDLRGGLGHTWSLGVEEQFYIVWPLVVILLRALHPRVLLFSALVGAGGIIAARFILFDGSEVSAFQVSRWTFTRADALLLGCALAVLMHERAADRAARPFILNGSIAVLVALALARSWQAELLPTAAALLSVAAVYAAVRGQYRGWLAQAPLVLVGRRSYALYLWHLPVLYFTVVGLDLPLVVALPVGVAASWVITLMSWRYIEEPVLQYRRRTTLSNPTEPVTL